MIRCIIYKNLTVEEANQYGLIKNEQATHAVTEAPVLDTLVRFRNVLFELCKEKDYIEPDVKFEDFEPPADDQLKKGDKSDWIKRCKARFFKQGSTNDNYAYSLAKFKHSWWVHLLEYLEKVSIPFAAAAAKLGWHYLKNEFNY